MLRVVRDNGIDGLGTETWTRTWLGFQALRMSCHAMESGSRHTRGVDLDGSNTPDRVSHRRGT